MKVLIIGCGSIGSRHISNLRKLGVKEIIASDINKNRLDDVSKKFRISKKYTDFKEAVLKNHNIDAAIICTLSSMHLAMAQFLAKHGINMLVEKPLATDLKNVGSLLRTVKKKGLVLMVAMCYRFNPGLIKLKKLVDKKIVGKIYSAHITAGYYLPYWHPNSDYRREYSARKSLGGGVVLDGAHSLDIMRWIFGEAEEVACFYNKLSDLEIDTEDTADFIFILKNGAMISINLDYLKKLYTNKIEVTGEKGNIYWDFTSNEIAIYNKNGKWKKIKYLFKINDMYVTELKHFLECVKQNKKPLVDGNEGRKTLGLVMAAKKSAKLKKFVKIKVCSK
jgi:predicted dehydrogenase